jgi:Protein of unknown function (DUF4236)
MGFFRFRRSFKILPGVRWNLNKGGSSFTFGSRGYHYTVGNKGSRSTVGIPGTGISYTQVHSTKSKAPMATPPPVPMPGSTQSKSKAGCLYAAGLTVLGVWLISFLGKGTGPTTNTSSSAPIAVAPVASSRPTPDLTTTALRATRVFSAAEEARLQKYVPPRVKLREDLELPATSANATPPLVYVGQGREVSVVRVVGSNLVVEISGRQATVPIAKTDFLERVIAEVEK